MNEWMNRESRAADTIVKRYWSNQVHILKRQKESKDNFISNSILMAANANAISK